MNENRPSIDGFIPRRRISSAPARGDQGLRPSTQASRGLVRPNSQSANLDSGHTALRPSTTSGLTRADLDQSLNDIGKSDDTKRQTRRRRGLIGKKQLYKRLAMSVGVVLLLVGGFIGIKVLIASGNIFKGSLFGLVQSAPLKTDANGRSNILIFGTSEDSESHNANNGAGGPLLTDSMMVLSVDQEKKDAYMVSIPRDMYVDFNGQACASGYSGRINEVYQCFSDFGANHSAGTDALRRKVGEVVGLKIQYVTQVNYTVVKDVVNAVGGISVKIESDDPRGIYDPNFDWQCGNRCNMVKYPNGPTGKLDGEHALALARARNANGGYGLARSNFDREQYQQKIIKAIREKAVSAGTITDLGKVTSLIDALGDNLDTDFETKEIRTLMSLAADIPTDKIISVNLDKADPPIYKFINIGGASLITPTSGEFNYTSIIQYVKQQVTSDPVVREQAKIGVYNGSGVAGVAGTEADKLRSAGYSVVDNAVGNAPEGKYAAYEIYDLTGEKSATKQRLESRYQTTVKTGQPPVAVTGLDFVIVVGKAPAED